MQPVWQKRSKKRQATRGLPEKIIGTKSIAKQTPAFLGNDWLCGLILLLAVFAVYSPVWWAGFIWDDDAHLTSNPVIIGPLGLKEIWTTHSALICPLVLTSFWVEHALWGLAPLPYHLVNVLLHGFSAIVLWQVLRKLQVAGAWLGAAMWAVHPVQVESVAWISEMKNTQSGLFFLLSILFFVRWLKERNSKTGMGIGNWTYGLTLLFAGLAMASKFSTAVLPGSLALCAWWFEGRWNWRTLVRLLPIVMMSVIVSVITLWPHSAETAAQISPQGSRNLPERLAMSGDVVWFYLGKLAWPYPLMTIYPRWKIDAGAAASYLPLFAAITMMFVFWLYSNSWGRPWFFAAASFLVALSPFLTLIDQSFWIYSFVEDHLQYLACMGPLALISAGLIKLAGFIPAGRAWLRFSLFAGVLLTLGLLSWRQTWAYESDEALWSSTLAKNPGCWAGYDHLGVIRFQNGHTDEAMADLQKSLELNPYNAKAYNNLGNILCQKGQLDDAIGQFEKALKISPDFLDAQNNLGLVLLQRGRIDDAEAHFEKAIEIEPLSAGARNGLGLVLARKGRMNDAQSQFEKAVAIEPDDAEFRNNLGGVLMQKGEMEQGMEQFQEALRLDPNSSDAQRNLAQAQSLIQQKANQK